MLRSRLLNGLQDHARLDRHRIADQVDVDDTCHAIEREHDLAALPVRDAAADQAGVAALRHHRDLLGCAELHDIRDFLCVGRPHHGERVAYKAFAPVGDVGMLALVVGDQTLVADDGAQLFDEVGHQTRSTLPGFMMFFGSSARLMVRIVSSSIRLR